MSISNTDRMVKKPVSGQGCKISCLFCNLLCPGWVGDLYLK